MKKVQGGGLCCVGQQRTRQQDGDQEKVGWGCGVIVVTAQFNFDRRASVAPAVGGRRFLLFPSAADWRP